jgi:hypothetical protein
MPKHTALRPEDSAINIHRQEIFIPQGTSLPYISYHETGQVQMLKEYRIEYIRGSSPKGPDATRHFINKPTVTPSPPIAAQKLSMLHEMISDTPH